MYGRFVRRAAGALVVAATVAAAGLAGVSPAAAAEGPVIGANRANAIRDSYVVRLNDAASPKAVSAATARDLTAKYGGQVRKSWQHALNGFSARMTAEQAARLAADPRVASVEQDATLKLADTQSGPPSWGLDRIDQRALPLSNGYVYSGTAAAVHVYVIDTGIRVTHSAFGGRASWGVNTTGDGANTDGNGHGTHVAGTVAGSAYGVAKAARVVAVKVLGADGSGSITGVVDGVNWVTANAVKPAVANMSLGASGASTMLEAAVRNSIASGVTYTVSAGNSNTDAANQTPARVAEAITVNASDSGDARASFSNYGAGTDLYAPGVSIVSAWHTGDTAAAALSGTSMAAPHVAGAAALWLAARPGDSPAAVQAGLIAAATTGKITNNPAGTPNRLLFTNPAPATPPPAPLVAVTPGSQTWPIGTPVSRQLTATGGTTPYLWTVTGLPTGLTTSTAGRVTGTPTKAGTGTARITVRDAAGRTASNSFTWTVAPIDFAPVTNATVRPIPDPGTVVSPVTITGAGPASARSRIEVHIRHPYVGNLVVELIAPDGTVYLVHNRTGGAADNLDKVYQRSLAGELAAGTWQLRVRDAVAGNAGRLVSWTLDL
ncbi:S8 family peptidase [Actinophytocola sp.]|uniref:S8 family peptidase n=1 Tax=Actinophytocola sp. TaxID=1872138 RepID=UPI002D8059BE|nr:S8 family serine peptidase [Actinophytocola sp.]HET9140273.1 S8 family serine peptidase [Actinophytocola sp.]